MHAKQQKTNMAIALKKKYHSKNSQKVKKFLLAPRTYRLTTPKPMKRASSNFELAASYAKI